MGMIQKWFLLGFTTLLVSTNSMCLLFTNSCASPRGHRLKPRPPFHASLQTQPDSVQLPWPPQLRMGSSSIFRDSWKMGIINLYSLICSAICSPGDPENNDLTTLHMTKRYQKQKKIAGSHLFMASGWIVAIHWSEMLGHVGTVVPMSSCWRRRKWGCDFVHTSRLKYFKILNPAHWNVPNQKKDFQAPRCSGLKEKLEIAKKSARYSWHFILKLIQSYSIPICFMIFVPKKLQWCTGWWLGHPSEKYDFVNWDDEIPNI